MYVGVDAIIVSILNFDQLCSISALLRRFEDDCSSSVISSEDRVC